jgi:SAM-dependent MidA family methyltransferase
MCHLRHRAHCDPFVLPGLQDITAHVDFSSIASALESAGLCINRFGNQGRFLLDNGLLDFRAAARADGIADAARADAAVQRLVSEHEMGELFKVLVADRRPDRDLTEP